MEILGAGDDAKMENREAWMFFRFWAALGAEVQPFYIWRNLIGLLEFLGRILLISCRVSSFCSYLQGIHSVGGRLPFFQQGNSVWLLVAKFQLPSFTGHQRNIGGRLILSPWISWPVLWSAAFFCPVFTWLNFMTRITLAEKSVRILHALSRHSCKREQKQLQFLNPRRSGENHIGPDSSLLHLWRDGSKMFY